MAIPPFSASASIVANGQGMSTDDIRKEICISSRIFPCLVEITTRVYAIVSRPQMAEGARWHHERKKSEGQGIL
jgi:hypothetical protein